MKKTVLFFLFIAYNFTFFAQTHIEYRNRVYKDQIKTVTFHQTTVKYGYPILELNSSNQLILEFDDLNETETDYSYTLIHCDQNWVPSDLNPIEYINGFESDNISDYENSFNTLIPYVHYRLFIPNENMSFTLSGNYLVYIYEGYDREKPVMTERFYVVDNILNVETIISRSSLVTEMDESQEVEINITDKKSKVLNPVEDITVSIIKNSSQEDIIKCTSPDFIKGNVYEYKNPRVLSIKGGNEYRFFNTKNLKYITNKFNSIRFEAPWYIFELSEESPRSFETYSYTGDINGNFLITSDHNENFETETEYVLVDFTYRCGYLPNGEIYIYGGLSNRDYSDAFKMDYDYTKKAYTKRLKLKQGFYDYAYVFYDKDQKRYSFASTEGNHYETENDYLILIYYKPQGARYTELLGYKLANTFKNL
jgi:hypothetical protein